LALGLGFGGAFWRRAFADRRLLLGNASISLAAAPADRRFCCHSDLARDFDALLLARISVAEIGFSR
jgi:hypothetical protein